MLSPASPAEAHTPACHARCACVQVVATFTVLSDIRTVEELEAFLARKAADIEAGIEGFTTNQLLGFLDFSKVCQRVCVRACVRMCEAYGGCCRARGKEQEQGR